MHTLAIMYHDTLYGIPCYTKLLCDDCAQKQDLVPGFKEMPDGRYKFFQPFYLAPNNSAATPCECDTCNETFMEGLLTWAEDGNSIHCKLCQEGEKENE